MSRPKSREEVVEKPVEGDLAGITPDTVDVQKEFLPTGTRFLVTLQVATARSHQRSATPSLPRST